MSCADGILLNTVLPMVLSALSLLCSMIVLLFFFKRNTQTFSRPLLSIAFLEAVWSWWSFSEFTRAYLKDCSPLYGDACTILGAIGVWTITTLWCFSLLFSISIALAYWRVAKPIQLYLQKVGQCCVILYSTLLTTYLVINDDVGSVINSKTNSKEAYGQYLCFVKPAITLWEHFLVFWPLYTSLVFSLCCLFPLSFYFFKRENAGSHNSMVNHNSWLIVWKQIMFLECAYVLIWVPPAFVRTFLPLLSNFDDVTDGIAVAEHTFTALPGLASFLVWMTKPNFRTFVWRLLFRLPLHLFRCFWCERQTNLNINLLAEQGSSPTISITEMRQHSRG